MPSLNELIIDANSLNYPERRQLTEDERIEKELSDLGFMFPEKKFMVTGESGSKKVEVVLDW